MKIAILLRRFVTINLSVKVVDPPGVFFQNNWKKKKLIFKNNYPFRSSMSIINTEGNAKNLEVNDDESKKDNANIRIKNNLTITNKSFESQKL